MPSARLSAINPPNRYDCAVIFMFLFTLRLAGSRALRPPKSIRKRTERRAKRWVVLRKEKANQFEMAAQI